TAAMALRKEIVEMLGFLLNRLDDSGHNASRASSDTGGSQCLLCTRLSVRVRSFFLQNSATYNKKVCCGQPERVYNMYP
ncbi:MAG: hypothetical protein ACX936_21605, partial [Marinobacter sp.]